MTSKRFKTRIWNHGLKCESLDASNIWNHLQLVIMDSHGFSWIILHWFTFKLSTFSAKSLKKFEDLLPKHSTRRIAVVQVCHSSKAFLSAMVLQRGPLIMRLVLRQIALSTHSYNRIDESLHCGRNTSKSSNPRNLSRFGKLSCPPVSHTWSFSWPPSPELQQSGVQQGDPWDVQPRCAIAQSAARRQHQWWPLWKKTTKFD